MNRVINFSAGPATLPLQVLEQAQADLVDYKGAGMSVMEMSHRSKVYDEIHNGAIASLRKLMGIGEDHEILFLQGGASLQFYMAPLNLLTVSRKADYVVTGAWSQKAVKEAQRVGEVNIAGTSEAENFNYIPEELNLTPNADYVHITTNNTIFGTQFHDTPNVGDVPLVADMSSDILSRPVDMSKYAMIYGGAQKNMGPSGVTLVIIRKDLLERSQKELPTMLNYQTHASKNSLFNTPPTWGIYLLGLNAQWLLDQGGLPAIAELNAAKSKILYDAIDNSGFYKGTAANKDRSWMNVTFTTPNADLDAKFIQASIEAKMTNLKGHRSVGGIRASIYNAMPLESVKTLVAFMNDFAQQNG
ncbi:MAG: 3-phosphoserine/phosphohydroxythreonine aminotransferase [Myxococcales bacterium]|nr:3-phosphoserine/phosphohydroxythreonine aminotransferase [Myxococcales bacterium]